MTSCRARYSEASCASDTSCRWDVTEKKAKRHVLLHAFNVLSHMKKGFGMLGACRDATAAERKPALSARQMALQQTLSSHQQQLKMLNQQTAAINEQSRQRHLNVLSMLSKDTNRTVGASGSGRQQKKPRERPTRSS